MAKTVRVPLGFYRDHKERDLPTPRQTSIGAGWVEFMSDDPALPELLDDARFYADADGPDQAPAGLARSAKALIIAIERQSRK